MATTGAVTGGAVYGEDEDALCLLLQAQQEIMELRREREHLRRERETLVESINIMTLQQGEMLCREKKKGAAALEHVRVHDPGFHQWCEEKWVQIASAEYAAHVPSLFVQTLARLRLKHKL